MWNRKDLLIASIAAAGAFGLTFATFLPRTASATDDPTATHTVISPVLHIGDCDIQAQTEGLATDTPAPLTFSRTTKPPASVTIAPGALPTIKLIVKNTSADKEAAISFVATDSVRTAASPISRVPFLMKEQWKQTYDLTLKPGETREIEASTSVSLDPNGASNFTLQPKDNPRASITALSFAAPSFAPVQQNVTLTTNVITPVNINLDIKPQPQ